jgi:hypothetical protein
MSLKFSKIVPKLTRGEVQRKEGDAAPAPEAEKPAPAAEAPAAEEKPELTPEPPIQVATEFVSSPAPAAAPPENDTGGFQLGGEASQFAEDLLEQAIGAHAEAERHPDAEPAPAEEPAIPKSFGFDFDADPDAPPSELAKAVSSALTDDPPSPFPDDDDEDEDVEDAAEAAADMAWLDRPAGPGVRAGAVPTHATETVDRRDTPAPPPAPKPEASPADIANELMLAADAGDTPPGGVPAAELERLLSSALEEESAAASEAAAAPAADAPALDPSQVAPGDFRGLAAGLIAELEASLHPPSHSPPEDRP